MAEPLTPAAEAALRAWTAVDLPGTPGDVLALLATLDGLRASLDPDNPAAVETWAAQFHEEPWTDHWLHDFPAECPDPEMWRRRVVALLRARAEAERP